MHVVIRAIHRVVYYISFVGMVVLLLMMLLTVGDVIGRGMLNSPIAGAYEVTAFMLVIVILFGIAYTEQRGGHLGVELFFDKLPRLGKIVLANIFTIMALGYFSMIVWQGWEEGFVGVRVGTTSDILHIPAYPFQFLIPFGAFLLFIELILNLIPSERDRKRREKGKEIYG